MEKVILIIAIAVLSLLHSWWKKRNGQGDEDAVPWPTTPPRRPPVGPPQNRPASAPPSQAANWEDELRRLMGEEPSRPAPPPVVVQQAPPPLPRTPALRPKPAQRPEPIADYGREMETSFPAQMPSLAHSAQAFQHTSNFETKATAHLQRADQQVVAHPKFYMKREASPEVRQAVSLVRNRQSQRAAILAGIILGPPKAMEE